MDVPPVAAIQRETTRPRVRSALTGPRRLATRLVCTYLGLYMAFGVLTELPGVGGGLQRVLSFFTRLMWGPGVPDGAIQTGSGDRAADWARVSLTALVAAGVVALWTLFWPRRHAMEQRFEETTRLLTRLALALNMFTYGAVKVLKSQFPAPNPAWLDQALGDASPMRLLWAFMGASTTYTVFTGLIECVAGGLLLARRTRLLGALASAAAMANVLLLNVSYDVPVKLGSAHFLAMACFVAWPDRARLLALLVPPASEPWPQGWKRVVATLGLGLIVLAGVGWTAQFAVSGYLERGDGRTLPPWYGRYDVKEVHRGELTVPLGGAPARWHRFLILDRYVLIKRSDGRALARELTFDDGQLILGAPVEDNELEDDEPALETFTVSEDTADDGKTRRLTLRSRRAGEDFVVVLTERDSRLTSRGLHWVSEAPYNR